MVFDMACLGVDTAPASTIPRSGDCNDPPSSPFRPFSFFCFARRVCICGCGIRVFTAAGLPADPEPAAARCGCGTQRQHYTVGAICVAGIPGPELGGFHDKRSRHSRCYVDLLHAGAISAVTGLADVRTSGRAIPIMTEPNCTPFPPNWTR